MLTPGGNRETVRGMDLDDLFARRPDDPLVQLARQDLDRFSVEELQERAEILAAEIDRVRRKIDGAIHFRASADALFKGSGA